MRALKDGCFRIRVDRDDVRGIGHSREVVAGAADAAREVERGRDAHTRLSHLALALRPTEIHGDAARRDAGL